MSIRNLKYRGELDKPTLGASFKRGKLENSEEKSEWVSERVAFGSTLGSSYTRQLILEMRSPKKSMTV